MQPGAFPVLSPTEHLRSAQTCRTGVQGLLQPLLSPEGRKAINSSLWCQTQLMNPLCLKALNPSPAGGSQGKRHDCM